jgi:DNA-binding response OmpR family regulator
MPVLILTARDAEADKVRGLKLGADDYVTKPFGVLELLARVEALLRRGRAAASMVSVRFGDVELDEGTRTVRRRGAEVALSPKEFDLLRALCSRQGAVISRTDLMREVWGYQADILSRTVDTHVAELRRKLEEHPASPKHILTVRKAGYRLQP